MGAANDRTERVSADEVGDGAQQQPALPERSLSVIFERVFEYRWLTHERALPDAAARAEALHDRLGSVTEDVREFWRASASGLAELGAQVGRLVDIGGGGVCVSTAKPLAVGATTEVRLIDDDREVSYEFPCVVVWAVGAPDPRAGLRFDGKPRRTRGLG